MSIKLLTKHHLEILSLKEGYTGLSESTLVKMPDCWKSHVVTQLCTIFTLKIFEVQVVTNCPFLFIEAFHSITKEVLP